MGTNLFFQVPYLSNNINVGIQVRKFGIFLNSTLYLISYIELVHQVLFFSSQKLGSSIHPNACFPGLKIPSSFVWSIGIAVIGFHWCWVSIHNLSFKPLPKELKLLYAVVKLSDHLGLNSSSVLAVWPCVSCLATLCLSFLFCKWKE